MGVTPSLLEELGAANTSPHLEGIEMEGYQGVIYSRFGLAGGWELSQSPYSRGYNNASAVKIGQNVLMYSVTQ